MTTELVTTMSAEQARELTDSVRADVATLWAKVLDLYEGQAFAALGYPNWREYWQAEFGGHGSRGEQLVRAGRVARALSAHNLPLPANDHAARQLLPVLRQTPDELPDVWRRAIEVARGQPTGRQIRAIVAPYRETTVAGHRAERPSHEPSRRERSTRRRRNLVGVSLTNAHATAETAHASLPDALRTDPDEDTLRAWLDDAEHAARALNDLARTLRDLLD